jgi:hypothetical protein
VLTASADHRHGPGERRGQVRAVDGKRPLPVVFAKPRTADDSAFLARPPAEAAPVALKNLAPTPQDIAFWESNEAAPRCA